MASGGDTVRQGAEGTIPFLGQRGWFLLTIFTSAFLLFMVQPMIARMALPRVGGAPAVWNSAMLVYQALLLGGYAYAHALTRLAPRRQALVHLALLLAAALTLPIALLPWTPPADANSYLWVPWLFAASIGPLFFVMSAHAPLLQRWYALSGCGDPYPLYAASNFGSFLGLLAYPFLVEPLIGVEWQSWGWSAMFALVVVLVAGSAARLPRAPTATEERAPTSPPPSWTTMARWVVISAIPSGLILSTTLHLTTDIVAMPLLWVIPLGLYLLSFSIAFANDRRWATVMTMIAPFTLLLWAVGVLADAHESLVAYLLISLGGFFLVATALHARLFDERPPADHLTRFYLILSLGGVVGGLFAALIAPLSFDWTYEHPLLLLAAAAMIRVKQPLTVFDFYWKTGEPGSRDRWFIILVLCVVIAILLIAAQFPASKVAGKAGAGLLMLLGAAAVGRTAPYVATVAGIMLVSGAFDRLAQSQAEGVMTRSFFGVYRVLDGPNNSRTIVHGTTTHGIQNLGSPEREMMATTYYSPSSGVGMAMESKGALFPNARVAVVGLGIGTLACYAKPGEQWSFYEIDPVIVDIAKDRRRFRFLDRCGQDAAMVVGDARLTLAQRPPGSVDLLVIDAFSSDSVPMHLLTREALEGYRRVLSPNGLLMMHISNRFLDLRPVVGSATANGWTAMTRVHYPAPRDGKDNLSASVWVALSPSATTIATLADRSGRDAWSPLKNDPSFKPWTDSYSSILPILR